MFLWVILHLKLLQNSGCVFLCITTYPHRLFYTQQFVSQSCIPVSPLPSFFASLVTTSLVSISMGLLLFCYVYSFILDFGEGNGNPLQDSCLENSMDRGACQATVHGVTKSWIRLSDEHVTSISNVVFNFHFQVYIYMRTHTHLVCLFLVHSS